MRAFLESVGIQSPAGLALPQRFAKARICPSIGVLLLALSLILGGAGRARGAASALTNFSDVVNPQIDATTVVNFGTINATGSGFLFQLINNLNFSNTIGAKMLGDVGFQLEFITNTSRFPSRNIVNQGLIAAPTLLLSATNLINSGELRGTDLVSLGGQSVTLSRSILSAAGAVVARSGFSLVATNGSVTYQNPSSTIDRYWGAGTGDVMTAASARPLFLPDLDVSGLGFRPPRSVSPFHEVQTRQSGAGALAPFVRISGTNFISFARTTQQGTNVNYQIVLVQTNTAATNVAVDVRFADGFGANSFSGNVPLVRFNTFGTDITTGTPYTNSLYFQDRINTLTNAGLAASLQGGSSRPAAYEFIRSTNLETFFAPGFGTTSNANIANISFYQTGFAVDTVTNHSYAAWQVDVGNAALIQPGAANFVAHLDDPTNFTGRVEIVANDLDLGLARISADNLVSIRATNLLSSIGTLIDAPFIQVNIANTNTTLILTNFATPQVTRPNGTISFYSTVWTNSLTNPATQLNLRYHVLMVDASQLAGIAPVTLQEFSALGTNVIINNTLNIGRLVQVNSPAVTFTASSSLTLPLVGATNLVSANFPSLTHFTNFGAITVPFQCALGSDRPTPLTYFAQRGALVADSITIRAAEFESSGTNRTRSLSPSGSALGGPISITADSAKFDGGTAGGVISAGGSIFLTGNDIKLRSHQVTTAGTLFMAATNSLADTGASGTNRINCALGFELTVKPRLGDLLGTTISTTAPFNRDVPHVWAGTDAGPTPAGYLNNAALGRLLLDTGTNTFSQNRLVFNGAGSGNALYVDYLELSGTLTNDLAAHMVVAPNMVIYFANANVPVEVLDGQLGGRLRWVRDYAGINSGVDVRLADGRTVKVNAAKLTSLVLDSDADGTVNGSDLSPFDGVNIENEVTFVNVPPLTAFIKWEAAGQTAYQISVNTNLLTDGWNLLATITNSATTNRIITFSDPVPAGGTERYYRVSYQP